MLQSSFVHLPGIGAARERRFWKQGIHSWSQLDAHLGTEEPEMRRILAESKCAWDNKNLHFFYENLPRAELWRVVPHAFDRIAYLDIETTGSGHPPICESTAITFYFKGEILQEHAHEKKKKLIRKVLSECSAISTFFGEAFDVPFLQKEYGIAFDKAHFDVCFWLKRHGYKGGLKKIQKMFSDIPARLSLDIDGFDAVRLWRMHESGVSGALDTLYAYNAEDTVVLESLLIKAYEMDAQKYPDFGLPKLVARPLPPIPTPVSIEVYRRLRGTSALTQLLPSASDL